MSTRLNTGLLAAATGALIFAVVWLAPLKIATAARLGTCYWGDPVVVFDGRELPVAGWPDGMSYDPKRGAVIDLAGAVLFHKGDLVAIEGRPVDVHGDPSPCFQIRAIKLDRIAAG
jgi:hypothetical protein